MNPSQSNSPKSATHTTVYATWLSTTVVFFRSSRLSKFLNLIASMFRRSSKDSDSIKHFTKSTDQNLLPSVFRMRQKESANFNNHLETYLFYKELLDKKRQDPRSVAISTRELMETESNLWDELYRIIPTEVLYHMEKDLNRAGVITARQQVY